MEEGKRARRIPEVFSSTSMGSMKPSALEQANSNKTPRSNCLWDATPASILASRNTAVASRDEIANGALEAQPSIDIYEKREKSKPLSQRRQVRKRYVTNMKQDMRGMTIRIIVQVEACNCAGETPHEVDRSYGQLASRVHDA